MLSRTAPRSRGTPATRSTTATAALCTMKNHICRADPPSDRPPHCQGACTVVPIDLRSCPAPAPTLRSPPAPPARRPVHQHQFQPPARCAATRAPPPQSRTPRSSSATPAHAVKDSAALPWHPGHPIDNCYCSPVHHEEPHLQSRPTVGSSAALPGSVHGRPHRPPLLSRPSDGAIALCNLDSFRLSSPGSTRPTPLHVLLLLPLLQPRLLQALRVRRRYMYCCCCCSYNLNSFKLFSARRPPLHVHVLPLLRPRLPTMLLPLLQPRLLLSCALELFSPRTPTATTSTVAPLSHPARVGGSTVSQVDPRIPRI